MTQNTLEKVREQVEFYRENANASEIVRCIFPRVPNEVLNKIDEMDFIVFVNQNAADFVNLGFTRTMADKMEKINFLFKRLRYVEGNKETIRSPKDAAEIFAFLDSRQQEEFWVAFLNVKNQVIHKQMIFTGGLSSSIVHPREVYRIAVKLPVASIVVAHNHPSGNPTPSPEDIAVTKRLKEVGEIMGIELLDHVIIGRNTHISLKEKGYM